MDGLDPQITQMNADSEIHCKGLGYGDMMGVMNWHVILEADTQTGESAVWCPELPGCASAGVTKQEALINICEAIELYLQPDSSNG